MKNITIIYWTSTGNTELIAKGIYEGIIEGNNEIVVKLLEVKDGTKEDIQNADIVLFGCSAMGVEEIDETEMEPFINENAKFLKGKKIALFGSYEWGSGEWIETWQMDMEDLGAKVIAENLKINGTPDENDIEECKEYGRLIRYL